MGDRELCVQMPLVRRPPSTSLERSDRLRFPSHVVVGSAMFLRLGVDVQSTRRHICAFVPHTGARSSGNRFHMSPTGEELSKYSADDPRDARAVSKLGVVGPELDSNS